MPPVVRSLLPAALAFALSFGRPPELLLASIAAIATLWMPGRGFARARWRDPLDRAVLGFWLSCAVATIGVLVAAWTGTGGHGVLLVCAAATAIGHALPSPRAEPLATGPRLGWAALLATIALVGWSFGDTLARPLAGHWWHAAVEAERFGGTAPSDVVGFSLTHRGDALRLEPRRATASLLGPMDGEVLVALQGPVGASVRFDDRVLVVKAAPTERPDEGPVPRYTDAGVAGTRVARTLVAGERLDFTFSDPRTSTLWVFPSADAVWDAHASGALRFVHYYQILNMEEQVRWARELLADRRVTDVQPPLGAYVAAAPLAVTGGDLPTQNATFLLVLAVTGATALACLRAWAADAPVATWLLPAGATAAQARLLLEPGSTGMPDSLYTAALLLSVGGLAARGPRYTAGALLAQLARYPGAGVAAVAGLLAGQPARVGRMLAAVLAAAAAFGLYGAATGQLDGWLQTVAWETGPEHWHGETDPNALLARAPEFYLLWLGYAGVTPLLAALRWPRGTRVLLGTALVYSGLLCTIDHRPSHYFVPLVQLSAVALGCTAGATRSRWARQLLPIAGIVGFAWSLARFAVTG